jgi:short-subunit dehydrogenase
MNMASEKGTALITGASTGIGATYADRFAKRGYDLVLVARDESRLNTLADRLRGETGVEVEVLRADLADPSERAKVETRLARDDITVFVNNAGMAVSGPTIEADLEKLDAMIELNVVAAARLARVAAETLARKGSGALINLASVAGLTNDRIGISVYYNASKAFMLSLSEGLDVELAPLGVRVQAVLPGVTRTEIWERGGRDVNQLPAEIIMEVDHMVDAALAGLDLGETVSIISLPDNRDWEAFKAARAAIYPNISHRDPAPRYRGAKSHTA